MLLASPSRSYYDLELALLNADPGLEGRYLLRIPVVLVDGAEAFEAKDMDLGGSWKGRLEGILAGLRS